MVGQDRERVELGYLSVCSGIEAATCAWEPLGWRPIAFCEIEPFPCAVLQHHYPHVPNLGDFTAIHVMDRPCGAYVGAVNALEIDALVGGTPCQSFSVAGLRGGLSDDRGNLALSFVRLADAIDDVRETAGAGSLKILWENVPGCLSTTDNAFGCILGALAGHGVALLPPDRLRWPNAGVVSGPRRVVAWRVLDAQWFGVAQRRRRVFVYALGGLGRWSAADALLPLGESVRRNHPARSASGKRIADTFTSRTRSGGGFGTDFDLDGGLVAGTLTGSGGGADENDARDGRLIAGTVSSKWAKGAGGPAGDECYNLTVAHTLPTQCGEVTENGAVRGSPLIAFDTTQITNPRNGSNPLPGDPCHTLAKGAHAPAIATAQAVRRLTPRECERLQGFPDDWTAIPWRGKQADQCPDGPRYRSIGNSMAVPVIRWIGARMMAAAAAMADRG